MDSISDLMSTVKWPALGLAILYFLFDLFDTYAKIVWHGWIKKSPAVHDLVKHGDKSIQHLHSLTFRTYVKRYSFPSNHDSDQEIPKIWQTLVIESFLSRLRRRISFTKPPAEIDYVEVAHRKTDLPGAGQITSFNAWEWSSLLMKKSAFYLIGFHTNRVELSPGTRMTLESGHTIVKMTDVHIDGDITLGAQHTNTSIKIE